jgi:PAS domain S-box-containing protein
MDLAGLLLGSHLPGRSGVAAWSGVSGLTVALVWATAAAVLSRLVRLDPALRRLRDVGWFLLVAVGAAPLAAAALRGILAVTGGQLAWPAMPAAVAGWWTAQAVGVLGVAPVAMVLLADRVRPPAPGRRVWRPRLRRSETAAQALAVAAASLLVLLVPAAQRPPLLCVCFVPVVWLAVRRGVPGAAAGAAALSALAVAVPVLRGGPATDPALAQLEPFVVVAAACGLYIGALAGERAAAHQREHQLSAILDAAPDCVATVDRAGRLLYLNAAGRRLLDLAEDEQVTGRLLRDLLPQLAARLAAQADLGPDLWKGATTMSAAQGRRVPLEHLAVAHLAADGRTEAVSAITRDVSHERHTGARLAQAEEQLEEHRLHLGAVLARVPIALVVAGVDGTCIRAQGRALERLGPGRPLPGCSLFHAFQGNDQLVGDLCQAAAGSAVSSCTTLGEAVLETHFRPVTGRNGKVRHVIGLLSDVTDRVRAEAAYDDLLARLDARDARRRDLDSALRADTAQTLTAWLRHLEILEEQLDSGRPVTALAPVKQTLEQVLDSAALPGLDPPAVGGPTEPLPDPVEPEQADADAEAAARPVAAGPDDEGTRALVLATWNDPGRPTATAPAAARTGGQRLGRATRAIPPAPRPDRP